MRLLLVLLLALTTAHAAPSKKILFIGNSYTAQIKQAVTGLIAASPHKDATLEFITPGGLALHQHLSNPKTLELITKGDWDFVVLQDQSQTPAINSKLFRKPAAILSSAITNAGARPVYYETWGHRDGDKKNAKRFPTYLSMQQALSEAYRAAAISDKALLAPVGTAWQRVRSERPDLELYAKDGSHPSKNGAFLAAACFYKTLFNESPEKLAYDHGLPAKEASYLRKIAASTR